MIKCYVHCATVSRRTSVGKKPNTNENNVKCENI